MFGYIIVNKPELKIKDYETYRSYYCGLCRNLRKNYGLKGQMTLTYDMTFLVMLLTGLYEPKTEQSIYRCLAHPFGKQTVRVNEFTAYAAAMNLILAYYKCEDDWQDERRIIRKAYAKLLHKGMNGMGGVEKKKREKIAQLLQEINRCEKLGITDIDRMAGLTGEMLGEVFAWRQDEWTEELRKVGFYLGKFIYICDAYEDVEKDIRSGNYNVLKELYGREDFDGRCRDMLTTVIAECCGEFEKLPIIENADILRNVLYSGVWCRYELTREKRRTGKERALDGKEIIQ